MEKYVFIETYGCSANQSNSEIMAGLLKQSGYEITSNEKIADILIFNTCIVKGKTESKIKRRIQDASKEFKDKTIIVAGCMPITDKASLLKLNPRLLLLGAHHSKNIVKLINDNKKNKLDKKTMDFYVSNIKEEKLCSPKISTNKLISITQISEGCNGACSYCKTRLAKGALFSYEMENIVKSIENDLKSGAKEVWITSQDCASYGKDKDDKTSKLPILLNKILGLKENFKLRLGMVNPNNLDSVLDEIIEVYRNPKMYKFLHMPLQSASNSVLLDMNRNYSSEIPFGIILKLKKEIPTLTFATDLIVGYPTEKNEDHKKNIEFIKSFRPDVLNLSKFSAHKGTAAEKLKPLDIKIVNKRTSELMELHRKTALENKKSKKGNVLSVFVNKKTPAPNIYEARDDSYNIVLISSKDKGILGKIIDVKITEVGVHHMKGEIVL